jgi:hypothetical protein
VIDLSARDRACPPLAAASAVEPSGPRELHQHWHFHGLDVELLRGAQGAEILHREQRPE